MTWVEKGVLKNLSYDRAWAKRQKKDPTAANVNMSLVQEGIDLSIDDMIKQTARAARHVLLVHPRRVDQRSRCSTPA